MRGDAFLDNEKKEAKCAHFHNDVKIKIRTSSII